MHVFMLFVLFVKVIQLTCPVCVSCTETLRPKPGLISHPKCLSASPMSMLSFTSHIFPGEFLVCLLLRCVFLV